jgi:hypothetical protein
LSLIKKICGHKDVGDFITLLHTNNENYFRRWKKVDEVWFVCPCQDSFSTAAYIVDKKSAKKLLLHSEKFFCPVDQFLNLEYLHGVILMRTHPLLASNDKTFPSLIGERIKPKISNFKKIVRNYFRLVNSAGRLFSKIKILIKLGIIFLPQKRFYHHILIKNVFSCFNLCLFICFII